VVLAGACAPRCAAHRAKVMARTEGLIETSSSIVDKMSEVCDLVVFQLRPEPVFRHTNSARRAKGRRPGAVMAARPIASRVTRERRFERRPWPTLLDEVNERLAEAVAVRPHRHRKITGAGKIAAQVFVKP